jgi:hypothetical protein
MKVAKAANRGWGVLTTQTRGWGSTLPKSLCRISRERPDFRGRIPERFLGGIPSDGTSMPFLVKSSIRIESTGLPGDDKQRYKPSAMEYILETKEQQKDKIG